MTNNITSSSNHSQNESSDHVREVEIFLFLVSKTHFTDKSSIRIQKYDMASVNHPDSQAHRGATVAIKSRIKYGQQNPTSS